MLIPNRTRLPSSQVSQMEPVDLQIAATLLKAQPRALPAHPSRRAPPPPLTQYDTGEMTATHAEDQTFHPSTPATFNMVEAEDKTSVYNNNLHDHPHNTGMGPDRDCSTSKSLRTSKSGSGLSSHHDSRRTQDSDMEISSDLSHGSAPIYRSEETTASAQMVRAQLNHAVNRYNALALAHGLSPITVIDDYVIIDVDVPESAPVEAKHHTIRERIKVAAGHILHRDKKLRRAPSNQSMKSIIITKEPNIFDSANLEELCKLGGLAPVEVPSGFSPTKKLEIPTSLAILTNNIVPYGPLLPEAFRLSGTNATVTALVNYFATLYIKCSHVQSPGRVQITVCTNQMPAGIEHDIHDVMAAYKRIIRDLPGGLLGSLELFNALRDIARHSNVDPDLPVAQDPILSDSMKTMIALALSAVSSDTRFAIICATMGLFAWIGAATKTAVDSSDKLMSYKAFATTLAPMLISEDLKEALYREEHGGEVPSEKKAAVYYAHIDDARAIARMMLSNWTQIVTQLRTLAVSSNALSQAAAPQQRLTNTNTQDAFQVADAPTQGQAQAATAPAPANLTQHVAFAPNPPAALRPAASSRTLREWLRLDTPPRNPPPQPGAPGTTHAELSLNEALFQARNAPDGGDPNRILTVTAVGGHTMVMTERELRGVGSRKWRNKGCPRIVE